MNRLLQEKMGSEMVKKDMTLPLDCQEGRESWVKAAGLVSGGEQRGSDTPLTKEISRKKMKIQKNAMYTRRRCKDPISKILNENFKGMCTLP